jgi:hypothetical protein
MSAASTRAVGNKNRRRIAGLGRSAVLSAFAVANLFGSFHEIGPVAAVARPVGHKSRDASAVKSLAGGIVAKPAQPSAILRAIDFDVRHCPRLMCHTRAVCFIVANTAGPRGQNFMVRKKYPKEQKK